MNHTSLNPNDLEGTSTKARIFMAAVHLFSQKGYSGVSVRDITHEVGINESSLYNHYKNKEALLGAIFEYFRAEMGGAVFRRKT